MCRSGRGRVVMPKRVWTRKARPLRGLAHHLALVLCGAGSLLCSRSGQSISRRSFFASYLFAGFSLPSWTRHTTGWHSTHRTFRGIGLLSQREYSLARHLAKSFYLFLIAPHLPANMVRYELQSIYRLTTFSGQSYSTTACCGALIDRQYL